MKMETSREDRISLLRRKINGDEPLNLPKYVRLINYYEFNC